MHHCIATSTKQVFEPVDPVTITMSYTVTDNRYSSKQKNTKTSKQAIKIKQASKQTGNQASKYY